MLLIIWLIEMVVVTFAPPVLDGQSFIAYWHFPLISPLVLWYCWLVGKRDG
ncbi:hypothetical protein [Cypionkella sp.]|uniref:hypothetical protein n=1 Tax=Cypionkella sp. TaxID=2811411 RepID=UPI00261D08C1|nr:hypothetical protein [Cypionkella sp.]